VGGIQSYVRHLAELCLDAGWEAVIFQPGSRAFESLVGRVQVRGVPVSLAPSNGQEYSRAVLPAVRSWAGSDKLVVVFGQVDMAVTVPGASSIGIQHGIYWDLDPEKPQVPWDLLWDTPNQPQTTVVRRIAAGLLRRTFLGRWRDEARAYKLLMGHAKGYDEVDVRVCVDHNFPNWYRTVSRGGGAKPEYVIINPAEIATPEQLAARKADSELVRIIFARRFFWYRGTGIMVVAGKRLLATHPNVRITLAGEGPDRAAMREYFTGESRIQFVCYRPEESLQTHLAHDVAVNASLGSEGSSLSVGEGMGAGCAMVATNVGGVTNMILDGYNGLLVNPNAEALYQGLKRVVSDAELRARLGRRAWETAGTAFSLSQWRQRWGEVIASAAAVQT
jgi:glycosyltransferase involved in cell wall biosynthesis